LIAKGCAGAIDRDPGLGNVAITRYHQSMNWARHA
jgi:hypothetical protein